MILTIVLLSLIIIGLLGRSRLHDIDHRHELNFAIERQSYLDDRLKSWMDIVEGQQTYVEKLNDARHVAENRADGYKDAFRRAMRIVAEQADQIANLQFLLRDTMIEEARDEAFDPELGEPDVETLLVDASL